jgi:hypothetical protein
MEALASHLLGKAWKTVSPGPDRWIALDHISTTSLGGGLFSSVVRREMEAPSHLGKSIKWWLPQD